MTNDEKKRKYARPSQVFILTDENVAPLWLAEVLRWMQYDSVVKIVVKAGEEHKNLQTVQRIWKTLMRHHADRRAMMVNLGGGVITDLGGFAASSYKRGIPFVNMPTTLMGMVDAAIGGKTGIDFGGVKNAIGTFAEPDDVMVNLVFLDTLPQRQVLSGLAEILKYGLISDPKLLDADLDNYKGFVYKAGEIKSGIVAIDPFDKGLRKTLNFGHTLGHAIESHCLTTESPLLHGEAVALGMAAALWLSVEHFDLDDEVLADYEDKLGLLLSEAKVHLSDADVAPILSYLVHDKKNKGLQPRFVLLKHLGQAVRDIELEPELVEAALRYIINKVSTE